MVFEIMKSTMFRGITAIYVKGNDFLCNLVYGNLHKIKICVSPNLNIVKCNEQQQKNSICSNI